jgi:hypothetical protein
MDYGDAPIIDAEGATLLFGQLLSFAELQALLDGLSEGRWNGWRRRRQRQWLGYFEG